MAIPKLTKRLLNCKEKSIGFALVFGDFQWVGQICPPLAIYEFWKPGRKRVKPTHKKILVNIDIFNFTGPVLMNRWNEIGGVRIVRQEYRRYGVATVSLTKLDQIYRRSPHPTQTLQPAELRWGGEYPAGGAWGAGGWMGKGVLNFILFCL